MEFNPSRIRIIWIAPRSPLGPPDGARHATSSLIHSLTHLGVSVDLVSIVAADTPVDSAAVIKQFNVLSCAAIFRSRSFLWRLPTLRTPFTFRTFTAPSVRNDLKERLAAL